MFEIKLCSGNLIKVATNCIGSISKERKNNKIREKQMENKHKTVPDQILLVVKGDPLGNVQKIEF